jgi:pyruvate dehydrogenase (quinone)
MPRGNLLRNAVRVGESIGRGMDAVGTPTVAKQLIDVLRQAGVERVYGIVGDSLNPVVDAIRRTEGIEWVHVRNEEAAAFAAAAQAQLTGRVRR